MENPKNLPVIKIKTGIFVSDFVNQDDIFKNIPWQKKENNWYERRVRAWLPKQHPIVKDFHYKFCYYYGEIEVVQSTYAGCF